MGREGRWWGDVRSPEVKGNGEGGEVVGWHPFARGKMGQAPRLPRS
jgi:hypothetical protein